MRKHREVHARLSQRLGDQLKGYCARSAERKWNLNWNDASYVRGRKEQGEKDRGGRTSRLSDRLAMAMGGGQ